MTILEVIQDFLEKSFVDGLIGEVEEVDENNDVIHGSHGTLVMVRSGDIYHLELYEPICTVEIPYSRPKVVYMAVLPEIGFYPVWERQLIERKGECK